MSSSTSKLGLASVIRTSSISDSPISFTDKPNELKGWFEYADKRVRIIRDLTEIHEVTWHQANGNARGVYVKYLRYATIIEGDINLTPGDKREILERILGQIIKWTSLKHPNVLPFLGYQWKDMPVLVFSWYQNGNITQYLKASPGVDRLKLLSQVAEGLKYLHSQSIVHADIKPNNIIIADDGHPMLMDFGMAPDLRTVERNMTIADASRENVGYMSPELIVEGEYSKPSDVYAVGALILEIMSGHPPFYKLAFVQAMLQINRAAKPSPEDHPELPTPSPLWGLMERCWITDPEKRPRMDEVCLDLKYRVKGKRSSLSDYLGLLCSFAYRQVGLSG